MEKEKTMKKMRRIVALTMALAMVLLAGCGNNSSSSSAGTSGSGAGSSTSQSGTLENYPDGPIQIILPAKPGGDVDSSGRLFAKDLEQYIGTTVVPVNVDGGGGNLAMKQIMDAEADGQQVINYFSYANAVLGGKLEYAWEDIVPVACYAKNDTQILIVSGDAPYDNAQELVEYMKENPNTVSFAVTLGSPSHYHAVAFEQASGTSFKKVDIGSGSDKIVAMLSGEVDVVSSTVGIAKDYIESGDVKVIGSLSSERSEFAPDIPTLNEQGVDIGDVGFAVYYTVWVKAGTPQEIIDALASSIEQMVNDSTYQEDCENLQFAPLYMGPEEVAEYEQAYYDFLNGMADVIQSDTF